MNASPERGDKVRYYWSKEVNGTYSLVRTITQKRTKMTLWNFEVTEISEQEYFRRKLAHGDKEGVFYI